MIHFIFPFFCFLTLQSYSQKNDTSFTAFNMAGKTDIGKIVSSIGNKRIVAIGEDTHGTKEYYQLRIALTKKLIAEKGFNVFILENPYEDMLALQDSLFAAPLERLMASHLFSIYQTKEMKDFLVWLKAYSKNHPIKMAGCDDSYRNILPALIKKEIKKYKDSSLDKLAEEFEQRQNAEDLEAYYALPGKTKPNPMPDDTHYSYDTYFLLLKTDSLTGLKKMRNERLSELLYEAISNYEIYSGFINHTFLSRDSAMGNRINYFTSNKKNKIIVWANNGHIAKNNINGELGKMGETIRKKNPGQYVSIGFATGSGSYSYINTPFINDDHDFSDTLFQASLLPLKKGSWQEYLNEQKAGDFLVNFNTLSKKQADFFNTKKPFRMVGYKKENPAKTLFDTPLYPLFDILVFFKKTTPTTPLFK